MSSILKRGGKLYVKVKNVAGSWVQLSTGLNLDQEAEAEKFIADREATVKRALGVAGSGPMTLRRYVLAWLDKRKTKTVKDDRTRLERHVLPRDIGDLLLVDVRPMHLRDLIVALKAEGKLAPKTIRQISGLMHSVFKSAEIEELVTSNPVKYERGVLPKKVDKDPTWRHEAIFTRAELVTVLADERRPADRRILSALKTLAGLRHTEAATMTWSKYDADEKPLGALNLGLTKSGVPRRVPVHPALAKLLAAWKRDGWEKTYGRKATPDDFIVPTRRFNQHAAAESQKQFVKDLKKLGLRHRAGVKNNRRGHDLRRTVITLARSDGANDAWLRWITHGPRANEMLDQYSSPPWETLCAELAKLKLELPEQEDGNHGDTEAGTVADLSDVEGDDSALHESEERPVQVLRRSRDRRVPALAGLQELPRGHGRPPSREDDRTEGQRRQLRAWELPVGDEQRAAQEHAASVEREADAGSGSPYSKQHRVGRKPGLGRSTDEASTLSRRTRVASEDLGGGPVVLGAVQVQSRQPRASSTEKRRPQRDSKAPPPPLDDVLCQESWPVTWVDMAPDVATLPAIAPSRGAASSLATSLAESLPDADMAGRMLAAQLIARSLRFEIAA